MGVGVGPTKKSRGSKKPLDKPLQMWYNKGVKRGGLCDLHLGQGSTCPLFQRYKPYALVGRQNWKIKKIRDFQEKPLDKSPSLWYNKDVNEGSKATTKEWTPTRASKPLMIKSSTARCSCLRYTNVNQTTQAEKMLWIRRIHKPLFSGGENGFSLTDC